MSSNKQHARTALTVIIAAILVAAVTVGAGYAESLPSSKAATQVGNINILKSTDKDWTPILRTQIKTSMQKDLFVNASLETGLYTQTLVKSRDMVSDTSMADAGVEVRVLVDGKEADPGSVVFGRRTQTLSATLQGQITTVDTNGNGILEPGEIASVAPEEIELILDTMNANSFSFVLDDVGVGVHDVVVQAKIDTAKAAQNGSASAMATIGKGSVTVEEVRLVKDAAITF